MQTPYKISPDYAIENTLQGIVAGIDEVGRGPWAGPVYAASVYFHGPYIPCGIDDSKKLTSSQRNMLYPQILASAHVGIGSSSVEEIEKLRIVKATHLAMQRALKNLPILPDKVIVDGNEAPLFPYPTIAIPHGDNISLSIAAASIVAKVTRDRFMQNLAYEFPHFGWDRNKGYGTSAHKCALLRYGTTSHHRLSFLKNIFTT